GREQPAQHADRGGLAAAVGAEKAEDLAALYGERKVLDDVILAEVLVDAMHVDDDVGGARVVHWCTLALAASLTNSAAAPPPGGGRLTTGLPAGTKSPTT